MYTAFWWQFLLVQAMSELDRLLKSYERELGKRPKLLGVALSSRKNLCVHPMVRDTPELGLIEMICVSAGCWKTGGQAC